MAHKPWTASIGDDLGQLPDGRRITANMCSLPPARGDRWMLQQVVVNLISNAVKFTSKRPEPQVEIGAKEGDSVNTYYVRDNGAGFDMKYGDKLFRVFHRLHEDHEFTGSGAGLAIVKRIIQRHGGKIWAEGELGCGATFYFTLPKGD